MDINFLYEDAGFEIGFWDVMLRYMYDNTRVGIFDSGCTRHIVGIDVLQDTQYGAGQYNFVTMNMADTTSVVFGSGGNSTFATPFHMSSNTNVMVCDGAILTVQEGNSTVSGGATLEVGANGTFTYMGELSIGDNGYLALSAAHQATVTNLAVQPEGTISFSSDSAPVNVLDQVSLQGKAAILLASRPVDGVFPGSSEIKMATFRDGRNPGSFSTLSVAGKYAGAECDDFVGTERVTRSSVSVLVSVTRSSRCNGGGIGGGVIDAASGGGGGGGASYSGGSGVPIGAIVGATCGCVAVAVLLVLLLVWVRKRRLIKESIEGNERIRARSQEMQAANRLSQSLKEKSAEMSSQVSRVPPAPVAAAPVGGGGGGGASSAYAYHCQVCNSGRSMQICGVCGEPTKLNGGVAIEPAEEFIQKPEKPVEQTPNPFIQPEVAEMNDNNQNVPVDESEDQYFDL